MAKNVKIVCNLTGDFRYVSEAAYNKLCKAYGGEEQLSKFYVKKEISLLIRRGTRIVDIATLHGFQYEIEKEAYYEELVKHHANENLVRLERKDSRTNFIQTDDDVKEFIDNWKAVNNSNG